jgi:hypothetical protein
MADPIAENEAEELAQKSYDASDPVAVNKARQRAGRKKATELEVIANVIEHDTGPRMVV